MKNIPKMVLIFVLSLRKKLFAKTRNVLVYSKLEKLLQFNQIFLKKKRFINFLSSNIGFSALKM